MRNYDVFISYKQTAKDGTVTEDYKIAQNLYEVLTANNISVFFSDKSLYSGGISDYKKGIDIALESSKVLIVIATEKEYLTSGWIEYEYETFYEDILSDRKQDATIVSYTKNISTNQLPRTLARLQNYSIEQFPAEKICGFIKKIVSASDGGNTAVEKDAKMPEMKRMKPLRYENKSIYASDYRNELKRLEIQANNARLSDEIAIKYILDENPNLLDEKICVLDIGSAYGYVAADRFAKLDCVETVLCIDMNQKVIERAEIIFAENPKMIFEVLDVESPTFETDLLGIMERHGIKKFHIVFSALTLHHLKNPNKVLRKVRSFLENDSYIILRGSDDGSKLCYPDSELMENIIQKYAAAKNVSDRYNGRKIYSQLENAGFRNVKMFSVMKDTSQMSFDEKALLFDESFSYRTNCFSKALENNPEDVEAKENLQWMENALVEFENTFYKKDFWYCEYDYVGVGKK